MKNLFKKEIEETKKENDLRKLNTLTEKEAQQILNHYITDTKTYVSEILFEPEYIKDEHGNITGKVISWRGDSSGITYFREDNINNDRYMMPFNEPKCVEWLYKNNFDISELLKDLCDTMHENEECSNNVWNICRNIINESNPYKEYGDSLWNEAKEKVFEMVCNNIKEQFDWFLSYHQNHHKDDLPKILDIHSKGLRFFRTKDKVEHTYGNNKKYYHYEWKFVNDKNSKETDSPCGFYITPLMQSGLFKEVDTDYFPNEKWVEFVLINKI